MSMWKDNGGKNGECECDPQSVTHIASFDILFGVGLLQYSYTHLADIVNIGYVSTGNKNR